MPITDDYVLVLYFKQGSTKDRVFAVYIYFTKHTDEEVCQKAITGLGRARSSHFLHGLGGWVDKIEYELSAAPLQADGRSHPIGEL